MLWTGFTWVILRFIVIHSHCIYTAEHISSEIISFWDPSSIACQNHWKFTTIFNGLYFTESDKFVEYFHVNFEFYCRPFSWLVFLVSYGVWDYVWDLHQAVQVGGDWVNRGNRGNHKLTCWSHHVLQAATSTIITHKSALYRHRLPIDNDTRVFVAQEIAYNLPLLGPVSKT